MGDQAYRGRNSLISSEEDVDKCKHTSKNWFLKKGGGNARHFARLVRFVSGHFPHGKFRERFNFEGDHRCWCGKADTETREHIWFDCDLWIRKHKPEELEQLEREGERGRSRERPARRTRNALDSRSPTPDGMTSEEHANQRWRREAPKMEDIDRFLCLNPLVGTFRWLDLVDQATKDREEGVRQSDAE